MSNMPSDDKYCEQSDLLQRDCAHCRGAKLGDEDGYRKEIYRGLTREDEWAIEKAAESSPRSRPR